MREVMVDLGERSYPVHIGRGAWDRLPEWLAAFGFSRPALLVTNPLVDRLYGGRVREILSAAGLEVAGALVPDGEEAKTLAVAAELYDRALAAGLDRHSAVFALGGGVVGDVAGFVAATLLRGIPFVQLPTTLLAQVDSSVGGKVAVNHPSGKNLIGAFHQPALVAAELGCLGSLPRRELSAGLAEAVKYGVIRDAAFFTWLEGQMEELLAGGEGMEEAVAVSCRVKAAVVAADEREAGERAILNFGHTVGHAVEALSGFSGVKHGEAVAIGMAAAARLSRNLGWLAAGEEERLRALLRRAGLPLELPAGITPEAVAEAMARDKKRRDGRLTLVLPETIGRVRLYDGLNREDVLSLWQGR